MEVNGTLPQVKDLGEAQVALGQDYDAASFMAEDATTKVNAYFNGQ